MEIEELPTDQSSESLYNLISQIQWKYIFASVILIIMINIIYMGSQKFEMKLMSLNQITHFHMDVKRSSNHSHSFYSPREFDIVLSYYAENVAFVARFIQYLKNVSTLQKLKPRTIVYNKNPKINSSYLKEMLNVDIVQQLSNLGREGATYLYHIIENYDVLANHILFSQAGVEGITDRGLTDWFLHRLEKQFNSSVGYMPLVENRWMTTYDCGVGNGENMQRMPELWAIIEQTLCPPGRQAVAFRGQFLVSAKRIRNRPLRVYKYINSIITADQTHWIHKDSRSPAFQSTPDNPIFGHMVERTWTTLFNCTKPDLPERCRRNECACFD